MSELTLDVGLAYKIKQALSRNGITDVADLDWLATGDNIAKMRRVRLGHAEITFPEHLIDLDADPFLPDDWSVEEHQKGGQFQWDAAKVKLYLGNGQKDGKVIEGNKLRKELAKKPAFNANLLDYLFDNPHLIPEEWKGKYVFFWGTIYRHRVGYLYVRFLYWFGGRWRWSFGWLGLGWNDDYPALVDAS